MNKIKEFFLKLLGRRLVPSTEALSFIAVANDDMHEQQVAHAASWRYGKEKGWTADLAAGIIAFKFASGRTGTSKFQTIGTFYEQESTFVWAWAQSSLPAALREHAKLAKHWGGAQTHPAFLQDTVKCSMEEAWTFAAVTRKLAGANSVYRGRVGNRYIFMTLDPIQIDEQLSGIDQTAPLSSAATDNTVKTPTSESHWAKGRRTLHW